MARNRRGRPFVRWMLILCPLVAVLYFGLWPELEAMKNPPIRGEIVFKNERPLDSKSSASGLRSIGGESGSRGSAWSVDWFHDRVDDLMTWERNPWKSNRRIFGSHYLTLMESTVPKDQARVVEIRRMGEELFRRVLERYPELAVDLKNLPPEENGFLKWLDFAERIEADPSRPGDQYSKSVGIPDSLRKHLDGEGPWDAEAMKQWLSTEQSLLDEIKEIGLMPEQSIGDIDLERWHFLPAKLAKSASEALLLDARSKAEEGRVDEALESVRAASGLADHFGDIETPTLLGVTVEIVISLQVQDYALSEIIPAVPEGQLDVPSWEAAVNVEVLPPSELGRVMRGEWNVTSRWWTMPMLSNTEDPKYPDDPDALIDHHATELLLNMEAFGSESIADWKSAASHGPMDTSYLSRDSRQLAEALFIGAEAWSKGLQRSQLTSAMTQAAFAIMKGEAIPNDPIHGMPYRWDPATRTLSPPDDPAFADIKPIAVPGH